MKNCRLIYRSTAVAEIVSNETIRDLADRSANANQARHISGLLLLSGNRFLQVLEGPHGEVNRLFGKIIRDTRHRDVELMSFEPMESAYFDAWHMRLVDLHDLPKQPREFIAAKYPNRQGVIEIPERLHEVYALLLDAKALCLTTPWVKAKGK